MAATAVKPPAQQPIDKELRDALQVVAPGELIEHLNLLVYGEAGAGKTHLAGTAADDPRTSPVLFLDVEGGITTLRKKSQIDVVSVRSIQQVEDVYNKLYSSIKDGKMYYKTVVAADSLTELADLDMRTIMKQAYNANPDRVDVDVPSPREWGKNRAHIRAIVRGFRDLPCHVIFTAQLGTLQEEGQPNKNHPGFAGKLKTEVPGFCDIVGFLRVDNSQGVIERTLQIQGTKRVVAKDRTSALGDILTDPTIPMMWDLVSS